MSTVYDRLHPSTWRPQARFCANIGSKNQLQQFNETGGIAVLIDVMRSENPDIEIVGSQSRSLSFWETRSRSGFVSKPKFSAGLLTLRFVTGGHISYLRRDGEVVASASIAALTGFDDLLEVRASSTVCAVSATITADALVAAYGALTGQGHGGFPALEPIAEMTRPGMGALLCTIQIVQRRLQELDRHADLLLPLFQEVIGYQLLSAWPTRAALNLTIPAEPASRQIRLAIDYIEANLSAALTLTDVASASGISVRSLQSKFKKELGLTPVQFIIERRLTRVHEELISTEAAARSISDIARSWGFVHMGDFGQRYRRLFRCSPSQTRRDVGRGRQHGSICY